MRNLHNARQKISLPQVRYKLWVLQFPVPNSVGFQRWLIFFLKDFFPAPDLINGHGIDFEKAEPALIKKTS